MQSRTHWIGVVVGLGLAVLVATPAMAGKAYRYSAPDGSLAFTDDLERIPEALRRSAEVIDTTPLRGYGRLSPSHADESAERIARLRENTDRLRKLADEAAQEQALLAAARNGHGLAPPAASGHLAAAGGYQATVEVNGATIRLPAAGGGEGPIVVEQVRAIRKGKNITQESTVVRQGDEILMVVFPDPHTQTNFNDFVREEDILEGRR